MMLLHETLLHYEEECFVSLKGIDKKNLTDFGSKVTHRTTKIAPQMIAFAYMHAHFSSRYHDHV